MLYSILESPSTYTPLVGHPVWEEALAALRKLDVSSPLGITKLRGDSMFVSVQAYETKALEACRYEGHRDMIDIQYIIDGGECVDWCFKSELSEEGAYDEKNDFQFYQTPKAQGPVRMHLKPGSFAVFFPEDGHRPQINDGHSDRVLKAVVKINRVLLEE